MNNFTKFIETETEIPAECFKNEHLGIEYLRIPDNVEVIGEEAFMGNKTIKTLIIPRNITIKQDAFKDSAIETLIIGGMIHKDRDSMLGLYSYVFQNSPISNVSINSVPIPKASFSGCETVSNVSISGPVVVEYAAFRDTNVKTVTFANNSTVVIGGHAFFNTKIATLELPKTTHVDFMAFGCCKNLEKVIYHDKSIYVGECAFYKCRNLKEFKYEDIG